MMRYLKGFDDTNHTATAENLPNHVAWCLGHCALMMHRAAERVDGQFKANGDFVMGQGSGDAQRFGSESVAFGSNPLAAGVVYPGFERCMEVFSSAIQRLAGAIKSCPDDLLDAHVTFMGGVTMPRWAVTPRMVFHNGVHCGQIAGLRRALKMPSIFG
jgi:hypothetical protein